MKSTNTKLTTLQGSAKGDKPAILKISPPPFALDEPLPAPAKNAIVAHEHSEESVVKYEVWLTFVAAYTVVSLIPGPSVLLVTSKALTGGLRSAFLCIAGDILGGLVLIALSLFGVGAILATSAELFQLVKWVGVFYMAYLGYQQIKAAKSGFKAGSSPKQETSQRDKKAESASLRDGFLVGVLNPKAIMFYVAFLSQFLDPKDEPLHQFVILVATSTAIVAAVLSAYALLASKAQKAFQSERASKRMGYAGGGFLLGGSLIMATTR